jgi:hypothetical protein
LNFLLQLFARGATILLMMAFVLPSSEVMAAFPVTTPLIKWNPADDTGVTGYTTTPEAACVKSVPYWVGQGYGPAGSVYHHVDPGRAMRLSSRDAGQ